METQYITIEYDMSMTLYEIYIQIINEIKSIIYPTKASICRIILNIRDKITHCCVVTKEDGMQSIPLFVSSCMEFFDFNRDIAQLAAERTITIIDERTQQVVASKLTMYK